MKFYLILLSLISFSGYSQVYKIPLDGKPLTVKTCSGRVYDNAGTANVIPNSTGSITIVPAQQGKIIKIELDTLNKGFYDSLFIYQGSSINDASLIGLPQSAFGQTHIYYGSEKDGAITLLYKAKESPFIKSGFSAVISCIDKAVVFDFTAEKFNLFESGVANYVSLYLYAPAQKEKAPTFKINVYYSKDKVLDKNDLLGESIFAAGLSTTPYNLNASAKIPTGLKGDYYIILKLDPDNFITETNEQNNILVSQLYTIK